MITFVDMFLDKNPQIYSKLKVKDLKYLGTSDGIAYDCDLYIGRNKICHINNAGMGGNTLVVYYTPKTKSIFDVFVNENKLKDFVFANGYEFMKEPCKISDEIILSEIVEDSIQEDENKKVIRKYQTNSIIWGNLSSEHIKTMKFKNSIVKISKDNGGKESIQRQVDKIKSQLKDGEKILNTNLSKFGIKV